MQWVLWFRGCAHTRARILSLSFLSFALSFSLSLWKTLAHPIWNIARGDKAPVRLVFNKGSWRRRPHVVFEINLIALPFLHLFILLCQAKIQATSDLREWRSLSEWGLCSVALLFLSLEKKLGLHSSSLLGLFCFPFYYSLLYSLLLPIGFFLPLPISFFYLCLFPLSFCPSFSFYFSFF